ncbi:TIR domain-containing protein [bacterium]|nr:TIR domain-containing protein [bacterium]
MADIFLSYKKEDRARIDALAAALQAEGFAVWFDYEIETGGDWFDQILVQLRAAPCVLGCWSNQSVKDGSFAKSTNSQLSYVLVEHREAGAKLLPVLLDAGAVPVEFGPLQAENLTQWAGDPSDPNWRKLIQRIEALVAPTAPGWVRRRMASHDATLVAERARREAAEMRAQALDDQLKQEASRFSTADRDLAVEKARGSELAKRVEESKAALDQISSERAALSQKLADAEKRASEAQVNLKSMEMQYAAAKERAARAGSPPASADRPVPAPASRIEWHSGPVDDPLTMGGMTTLFGRVPALTIAAALLAVALLVIGAPVLAVQFGTILGILTAIPVAALLGAVFARGCLHFRMGESSTSGLPSFRLSYPGRASNDFAWASVFTGLGAGGATLVAHNLMQLFMGASTGPIELVLASSAAAFIAAAFAHDRWEAHEVGRFVIIALLVGCLNIGLVPTWVVFGGNDLFPIDLVLVATLAIACFLSVELGIYYLNFGGRRVLAYAFALPVGGGAGLIAGLAAHSFFHFVVTVFYGADEATMRRLQNEGGLASTVAVIAAVVVSLIFGEIAARDAMSSSRRLEKLRQVQLQARQNPTSGGRRKR